MLVKLVDNKGDNIELNPVQIIIKQGNRLLMNTGLEVFLSSESHVELDEHLYGTEESPKTGASEHTMTLLNDLHKLTGGRGEAKATTDRKARLKARLKDFSEEELKQAASNLGNDEFMQGANDNNKRYGTIDYLLRTSAQVNKWLEETPQKKKGMF